MRRIAIPELGLVAYGNDDNEAESHLADMLRALLTLTPEAVVARLERAGLKIERSTPSQVIIDAD